MMVGNKWCFKEKAIRYKVLPFLTAIGIILNSSSLQAQTADTTINKKRLRAFTISSSLVYSASLATLHQVWYKNAERQSFRFFNDLEEWKQTDKIGHFYSSFFLSYATAKSLTWGNVAEDKANLIAAATGFLALLPVEIFDGFSDAYGASTSDILANGAGAGFFIGQNLLWKEIRIQPKFSFRRTPYAEHRPQVLGDGFLSEMIKDYNGQTYWLSFDMDKFFSFPKWLNVAAGYGAEEMFYARDHQNVALGLDPHRQYYLSIDFDLSAIRTNSKFVKTLIFLVSAVKLPAPALEFSKKGINVHAFYF